MSRFQIGERVFIADSFTMKHKNREGTIVAVHVNRHNRAGVLDKYTVQFDDREQADFYEMHLKSMTPMPEPCSTRASLNRQFQDASEKHTHALRQLARSVAGSNFDAASRLVESARMKVAESSEALKAHRVEHDC